MTDTSVAAPVLSRAEFIGLAAALMAINALAIDVMLPALPEIGRSVGMLSANDQQLIIGAYLLGFGAGQPIFGPLADRFGRRGPLLAGLGIYFLCAVLCLFAPDFGSLLLIRFVQGLGAASTRVIATAVVRDRFSGREMAEIMSMIFVFHMAVPVIAPGLGQLLLLTGQWHAIFLSVAGLAAVVTVWTFFRLPETLTEANRRPLTARSVVDGFRIVFNTRPSLFYGIASTCMFGAMFGFLSAAQQIFVDVYQLGPWFPLAFAVMAGAMAVSSFLNSRFVRRYGMRRLSHTALLLFLLGSALFAGFGVAGFMPFWVFLPMLTAVQFAFGWTRSP